MDKQIEGVFTEAGEPIKRTSSGRDLMRQLGQATPRLLCSLVHKFGRKDVEDFDAFIKELEAQPSQTMGEGFISLCGGSTFLEIGKTQLAAFEVRVPTTKAEQTAIAAILSDMDAEAAALEAKLTKARSIKQGMMQELLTGRIRLV